MRGYEDSAAARSGGGGGGGDGGETVRHVKYCTWTGVLFYYYNVKAMGEALPLHHD